MKDFDPLVFDPERCQRGLAEFKRLLESHESLGEKKEILPFFRARPHLSAFLRSHHPGIIRCDRIAFECNLFGDFACDLVVGDSNRKAYCFIEFEDARPNSIFETKRGKSTPEGSRRFDHGSSQVIDWFWILADLERTNAFGDRFDGGPINSIGLLIVGRSKWLGPGKKQRLEWRRKRVLVNSIHVNCYTFDELYETLIDRFSFFGLDPQPQI